MTRGAFDADLAELEHADRRAEAVVVLCVVAVAVAPFVCLILVLAGVR